MRDVMVTSLTPSVRPIRARTSLSGGIAARSAANWSDVWTGSPSIAKSTSWARMPACLAGLGSETFTMTSRPVIMESSTVSPSQPELCGPLFVLNVFFFCESLSVFLFRLIVLLPVQLAFLFVDFRLCFLFFLLWGTDFLG